MATSALCGIDAAKPPARAASVLLYVLCGALALYPLLEKFAAPVIAASFALAFIVVLLRLMTNGFRMPVTFLGWVWCAYFVVYGVWLAIAVLQDNRLDYAMRDSLGFLLYFGFVPVLFLYIVFCRLEAAFTRFIVGCCITISALSVVAVVGYYVVFGELDGNTLLVMNAFLASAGMNWQIDNNSGLLGMYTNTAHLLLLGTAIVLYRYVSTGRWRHLGLAALFLVGTVLDGHRALVIAALLQFVMLSPQLLRRMKPSHQIVIGTVVVSTALVAALLSGEWIQARFDFSTEDVSTAERHAQIPALLDKIAEAPVMGSGFGSFAAYIRSSERPFSYEVDFLATVMKLGLVGGLMYFGTYLLALAHGWRRGGREGVFLLSAGLPFFFYMGTNGNQAMSTDSAVFHIFIFMLIAFAVARNRPRHEPAVPSPSP